MSTPYQYNVGFFELFRSVEFVWTIWAICLFLFACMTARLVRYTRRFHFRDVCKSVYHFCLDEKGGTYSLSVVMVLPFYVIIIAMILETTFLLCAKMGTIYAAFASVRSAIVWTTVQYPAEHVLVTNKARQKAKQAAVQAMVPFASGLHSISGTSSNSAKSQEFLNAHKAYVKGHAKKPLKDQYILNKYCYAEENTEVTLEGEGDGSEPWKKNIVTTVSYDAPFLLPYIGKLLGGRKKVVKGRSLYCYAIESKAALLNECPMNDTGSLGINYATSR